MNVAGLFWDGGQRPADCLKILELSGVNGRWARWHLKIFWLNINGLKWPWNRWKWGFVTFGWVRDATGYHCVRCWISRANHITKKWGAAKHPE